MRVEISEPDAKTVLITVTDRGLGVRDGGWGAGQVPHQMRGAACLGSIVPGSCGRSPPLLTPACVARARQVPPENFTHMFDWFWSSSSKPKL